jgi:hypothetical protein
MSENQSRGGGSEAYSYSLLYVEACIPVVRSILQTWRAPHSSGNARPHSGCRQSETPLSRKSAEGNLHAATRLPVQRERCVFLCSCTYEVEATVMIGKGCGRSGCGHRRRVSGIFMVYIATGMRRDRPPYVSLSVCTWAVCVA